MEAIFEAKLAVPMLAKKRRTTAKYKAEAYDEFKEEPHEEIKEDADEES